MTQSPPLIPRKTFFGNPERTSVKLSPDGTHLTFLAPKDNALNVWVAPVADPSQARAITNDRKRGIRLYSWCYSNTHILYLQDSDGDENWHLYRVNLETGETKNLTPFPEVQARIVHMSPHFPTEIIVGLNNRNPQFHDLHRLNIETGEKTLMEQHDAFMTFVLDDVFQVHFGGKMREDGGVTYQRKSTTTGAWEDFMTVTSEDYLTTSLLGLDKAGTSLYMIDSRRRNTSALSVCSLDTAPDFEETLDVIFEDPQADVSEILQHPTEKTLQAVASAYERTRWTLLDPRLQEDFDYLTTLDGGEMTITSRTQDDRLWIVAYLHDAGPVQYYLYHRSEKRATHLFSSRDVLNHLPLAPMHPVIIEARDGEKLVSYLTLPLDQSSAESDRPRQPVPMVLYVHGGPWVRDEWGYHPIHQWLANRGYAVLSVNYRGSTGFGKKFTNLGDGEWGRNMQHDLTDAVAWAIDQKIADPEKVAIMGGSYGGYATLAGLTFTPGLYACGIDIVGVSNLNTFVDAMPPYWKPFLDNIKVRLGADFTTEEGRAFLKERSPFNYVEAIEKPLLIGHGANDPRVKQAESDQIVTTMAEQQIPVTYVLYPDEGHGFAREENRLSFYAVTEAFLSPILGGRHEPIGEDFKGASLQIKTGEAHVMGIKDAMMGHAQ